MSTFSPWLDALYALLCLFLRLLLCGVLLFTGPMYVSCLRLVVMMQNVAHVIPMRVRFFYNAAALLGPLLLVSPRG